MVIGVSYCCGIFVLHDTLWRRVSSVANPKVPGSIPGPVSYRGHGL